MIFLILVLGLVLRLISLNQSFWLDEATSATVARDLNVGQIITQFAPGDFHPPLYYLLLKVWTLPFGVSEISARSFSIACALLSILFIYLIGKEIKNKSAGLFSALLLATSPLFIYYSQEARMYVLTALLVLIAVYLFIKFLNKITWWNTIGLTLVISALTLTDYVAVLIVPVFWILAFVSRKSRKWWLVFISIHLLPMLIAYWWSPIFMRQLGSGLSVGQTSPNWWKVLGGTSLKELLLVPIKFMIGRISFAGRLTYGLVVASAGLLFGVTLIPTLRRVKNYALVYVWLLVPVFIAYIISFIIPVFSYFRLLFVLPAFYLLIALGLTSFSRKFVTPILALIIVYNLAFSYIYLSNVRFQREDWRSMSNFVTTASQGQKSEVLFVTDGQMEAYRYYNNSVPAFGPAGLNQEFRVVWLSRYVQPMFDPQDGLRTEIEKANYKKVGEYDFNGVVVWRYEK